MDLYHRAHRRRRYVVVVSVLCVAGWLLYFTTIMESNIVLFQTSKWRLSVRRAGDMEVVKPQEKVVILMWTPYFNYRGPKGLAILGIHNISYSECFQGCEIATDRGALDHADAVLFHAWPSDLIKSDMPRSRKLNQWWVLLEQESPILTRRDLDTFSGVFNWTMTYRKDSDVFHPYGKIVPLQESEVDVPKIQTTIDSIISHKSKLVAGVISKCQTDSHREVLISQLHRHIPVDIYGKCGIPSGCAHGPNAKQCSEAAFWNSLTHTYKFYLSFENALCVDYVTEKLFRTLELGLVPVVYGGVNYSLVAPPHSFIDARKFKTPQDLAEFLIMLDSDPKEYRRYFQWRYKYAVRQGDGFCTLCKKLAAQKMLVADREIAQTLTVYDNLHEWWFKYPVMNSKYGENFTVMREACSKPSL